jgi:single-strand DNA-binding protein
MTQGLNKVMLFGNLGANPELRSTATGTHVLSFRVATTEVYFDKQQQKQERTEWHQVALFGARAEPLSRLLHKGSRVLVEGRLQTTSYDKDGSKRYKTEVIASDLLLGGPAFGGSPFSGAAGGAAAGGAVASAAVAGGAVASGPGLRREGAAVSRSRAALAEEDVPF